MKKNSDNLNNKKIKKILWLNKIKKLLKKNNAKHTLSVSFKQRLENKIKHLSSKIGLTNDRKNILVKIFIVLLVTLTIIFLTSPRDNKQSLKQIISSHSIRASHDFSIIDDFATAQARYQASLNTPAFFLLDDLSPEETRNWVNRFFEAGRTALIDLTYDKDELYTQDEKDFFWQPLKNEANLIFPDTENNKVFDIFLKNNFNQNIERAIYNLTLDILSQGVVNDTSVLDPFINSEIIIHREYTKSEEIINFSRSIPTVKSAHRMIEQRAVSLRSDFSTEVLQAIIAVSKSLIKPNLKFNPIETDKHKLLSISAVSPVKIHVKEDEIIVREGEIIDDISREKLKALYAHATPDRFLKKSLGLAILVPVFFIIIFSTIGASWRKVKLDNRDLLSVGALMVLSLLIAYLTLKIGSVASTAFQYIDEKTFFFLIPMAFPAILATVFLGARNAVLISFLAASLIALLFYDFGLMSFFYSLMGSLAALSKIGNMHNRSHLILASLWASLANVTILTSSLFYTDQIWTQTTIYYYVAAILSGFLSGITANGFITIFESLFGYSTNIKLMELSNLGKPLLRQLMLNAPGTYHHCVVVGAMVEAAAEAIKANHLLAKVGAYYHDLGKLKKPLYFVENQQLGRNKHDFLAPSMSALILISHIKEGVDLAKKHKIPKPIIDIIQQHHGTSLMAYFFHKAKENRSENQAKIQESSYRYPGPKPHTKEAALVMLADVAEAATRSLDEPSPIKIQTLTQTLMHNILIDGQLNNCELTFNELSTIKESFDNILIGIYHRRVSYPDNNKRKTEEKIEK